MCLAIVRLRRTTRTPTMKRGRHIEHARSVKKYFSLKCEHTNSQIYDTRQIYQPWIVLCTCIVSPLLNN